jgi:hypothetical protein
MGVSKVTIKSYIVQALAALRKTLSNNAGSWLIAVILFFKA